MTTSFAFNHFEAVPNSEKGGAATQLSQQGTSFHLMILMLLWLNGFGSRIKASQEKQVKTGASKFTLHTFENYNQHDSKKEDVSTKDRVDYELHFKKAKEGERYFFNSYTASLEKNGQSAEHKFYIDKGNGMTRKEAYNLLDGRAVYKELKNKENETYNAWLKLDPEKKDSKKPYLSYSDGYGYNVVKALEKLPIKELRDEGAMKKIIEGLEKGNLVPVTHVKDGNEAKVMAAANPQFKSVELYGMDGKKLFVENDRGIGRGAGEPGERQLNGYKR